MIRFFVVLTLAFSGATLLLYVDWRIAVGVFLLIWANNLGRDL